MKKVCQWLFLLVAFMMFSLNASALYEENGEVYDDDEIRITAIEDNGDTPISNDDEVRITDTDDEIVDDTIDGEPVYGDTENEPVFTTQSDEDDDSLSIIIISALSGFILGGAVTYYMVKKEEE